MIRPTALGRALVALDKSEASDMGNMSMAELHVAQAQVYATLAVAEQLQRLVREVLGDD